MKQRYVTTAIPYANAKPHVGNALDYLYADIYARYHRQAGNEVRLQLGTDEHGNKITVKAHEMNMTSQELVDTMYRNFQNLADNMSVEYTDFNRTTDPDHERRVQLIWQKLEPYIYKNTYEGFYCTGCENFVTEKEAQENGGICPDHDKPYERLSEENYYLRVSDFSDRIRSAIESDELKIIPAFRKKELLQLIKDGARDVSISRPRKNLSWGVSVPGDESQVMYVWMDALCNYITLLGYPDNPIDTYWPADLQVIGKDIVRFHGTIWPAILFALELPLPNVLLAHGHINVDGQKMSKTLGNVVDPNEIIEKYGVEAFRYYCSRHVPTLDDGDFTWEKMENAYNGELGNDLGNLVQRVTAMALRYVDGDVGDIEQNLRDVSRYDQAMKDFEFNSAIDIVWEYVRELNGYLEQNKPWELAKQKDDPEVLEQLRAILNHCSSSLYQVADLLYPFMPATAMAIRGVFAGGTVQKTDGPLFPKKYFYTPDPRAPKS